MNHKPGCPFYMEITQPLCECTCGGIHRTEIEGQEYEISMTEEKPEIVDGVEFFVPGKTLIILATSRAKYYKVLYEKTLERAREELAKEQIHQNEALELDDPGDDEEEGGEFQQAMAYKLHSTQQRGKLQSYLLKQKAFKYKQQFSTFFFASKFYKATAVYKLSTHDIGFLEIDEMDLEKLLG
jgi:hypothetical protein